MTWLIASLCAISGAASPTAASAKAGSEAVSAKPIVIAYLPAYVQQRVPGHQHQHKLQATPYRPTRSSRRKTETLRKPKMASSRRRQLRGWESPLVPLRPESQSLGRTRLIGGQRSSPGPLAFSVACS